MCEQQPKLSLKVYLISVWLIICTVIQIAHVKTAYNVPHRAVLKTFNETLCFDSAGGCKSNNVFGKIKSSMFWSIMVVSEPLGVIPAILTGRPAAEALGKITVKSRV